MARAHGRTPVLHRAAGSQTRSSTPAGGVPGVPLTAVVAVVHAHRGAADGLGALQVGRVRDRGGLGRVALLVAALPRDGHVPDLVMSGTVGRGSDNGQAPTTCRICSAGIHPTCCIPTASVHHT
jgi:hypothetical protein